MAACKERAGFLFSHRCDEPAVERCSQCQASVCQAHTHLLAGSMICSSCAKKSDRKERRAHRGDHDDYHSRYRGSPYFYGSSYYGYGYGYYGAGHWGSRHMDRHDFTEADAGSLTGDAGEGFEDDVGGS